MRPLSVLLVYSVALCVHAQASEPLKLTKAIALPGVKGRFDHFALDANNHRLFVAALGNNTLEVLDVSAGKHVKSIAGLHKPTGVLFMVEQNLIAVADGDDGSVKLFDGTSYDLMKSLGSLDDADNMRFDPKTKLIYVGYTDGALGIVDLVTQERIGKIKLKAHPESFQLEKSGNRIFVNVPDAKQIAVIDREKKSFTAIWPMEKFQANFPMALDEATHRLFIGCRKPARLVVFNTEIGKPVADLAISGDADDLFFDAKRQRIYLSCGEGFVDVVSRRTADIYQVRERVATRPGARTSFFSDELNEFYLAVPQRGNQPAEIRIFEVQ